MHIDLSETLQVTAIGWSPWDGNKMTNLDAGGGLCSWGEFGAAMPHLESFGRRRLEWRVAYLGTIRKDGSPRVHPVSPFIGAGCLFVYMEPTSPKVTDLRRDARYALHGSVENDSGGEGEFYVTGLASEVVDESRREEAFEFARAVYKPQARHILFELRLAQILSTTYEPSLRRERWSANQARS